MGKWFPPQNWAELGKKVIDHDNLFAMIDYFLTQNVSSAEAERGSSVLKGTTSSKRATLTVISLIKCELCFQVKVWNNSTSKSLLIYGLD